MRKMRYAGLALLILGFVASVSWAPQAEAAGYLKIGDIKGESTDRGHKDWINLLSVSFGDGQTGARTSASGGPSTADAGDVVVVKKVDKSTPKIQEACTSGKHFKDAVLHVRKAGADRSEPYLRYKLKDVMVTSCSTTGSAGNEVPMETLSLNFAKIETTYSGRDDATPLRGKTKGKVETEWKVEEGE